MTNLTRPWEPDVARSQYPLYDPEEVNAAGKIIRAAVLHKENPELPNPSHDDWLEAVSIAENFRASHGFPQNTFYMTLRNRASRIVPDSAGVPIVSQRTKRAPSIVNKLADKLTMKLASIQDIGGCRAVLPSVEDVYTLRDYYYEVPVAHRLSGDKPEVDYIAQPREDTGYRSLHLKYRFTGFGKSVHYDGLRIEIQLRTQLQHRWSTAVEAAQAFTQQALKSNRGPEYWQRFFRLMSGVYALKEETAPPSYLPSTMGDFQSELAGLDRENYIVSMFEQYSTLIPKIEGSTHAKYFLVMLDPIKPELQIKGFSANKRVLAYREYFNLESAVGNTGAKQVVLVSASNLRRAYPNYFLNTRDFLLDVRSAIAGTF